MPQDQPTPPLQKARSRITVRAKLLIAGVLAGVLVLYLLYHWWWVPYHAERMTYQGASTKLKRTIIVPNHDAPIVSGKNVIWCGTFQAAWDQMNRIKTDRFSQPIRLLGAEQ